ncbi:hypothetical protein PoB_004239500 [Plakobranchus ocellatus]|uniref:Uncharacterized protein n=1 Tax=Plakobranchus ocellatus TaxID=259542 RepID=A0AAV4B8P6_9GAST|nr:hypothetical protein PoB_004239500 [Plakobranchus ocellatus]
MECFYSHPEINGLSEWTWKVKVRTASMAVVLRLFQDRQHLESTQAMDDHLRLLSQQNLDLYGELPHRGPDEKFTNMRSRP